MTGHDTPSSVDRTAVSFPETPETCGEVALSGAPGHTSVSTEGGVWTSITLCPAGRGAEASWPLPRSTTVAMDIGVRRSTPGPTSLDRTLRCLEDVTVSMDIGVIKETLPSSGSFVERSLPLDRSVVMEYGVISRTGWCRLSLPRAGEDLHLTAGGEPSCAGRRPLGCERGDDEVC